MSKGESQIQIPKFHLDAGKIFYTKDSPEGYLYSWITTSQTGPLSYFLQDGTERVEYVTYKALSDPKYISSLVGKPITSDHPSVGLVDSANWGMLGKGTILDTFLLDDQYLNNLAIVTDKELIEKIKSGEKKAASTGYFTNVQQNADGQLEQVARRANHVAAVQAGRAPDARFHLDWKDPKEGTDNVIEIWQTKADALLLTDSQEDQFKSLIRRQLDEAPILIDLSENGIKRKPKKVKQKMAQIVINLDGVNQVFELDNDKLVRAIGKLQAEIQESQVKLDTATAQITELEKAKGSLEGEIATLEGQRTTAVAEKDATQGKLDALQIKLDESDKLRKDAADIPQEKIQQEISARLAAWNQVLPTFQADNADYEPDYAMSVPEIQKAFLKLKNPALNLDTQSSAYVQGMWDMFISQLEDDKPEPTSEQRSDSQLQLLQGRGSRKKQALNWQEQRQKYNEEIRQNGITK